MTPYAEQALRFQDIKNFKPHSTIDAIGFILFEAIRVDGGIAAEEIAALKTGLSFWDNSDARKLLAAINFCLTAIKTPSIGNLEKLLTSNEEKRQAFERCVTYLR